MNRLDEPVFMAVPKPLQTEFGIHYRLEICGQHIEEKALSRTELNKQHVWGHPANYFQGQNLYDGSYRSDSFVCNSIVVWAPLTPSRLGTVFPN